MSEHKSAAGESFDGQGGGSCALNSHPIKSSEVRMSSLFTMNYGSLSVG